MKRIGGSLFSGCEGLAQSHPQETLRPNLYLQNGHSCYFPSESSVGDSETNIISLPIFTKWPPMLII